MTSFSRRQLQADLDEIPWCTCLCHEREGFGTPWRWFIIENEINIDHLCTDCLLTMLTKDTMVWFALVRAR